MPDRSEVEAVPREFVPVDFADAFIRVHPWHPCSNWMRSRLALAEIPFPEFDWKADYLSSPDPPPSSTPPSET